jgi:hypothetical protein
LPDGIHATANASACEMAERLFRNARYSDGPKAMMIRANRHLSPEHTLSVVDRIAIAGSPKTTGTAGPNMRQNRRQTKMPLALEGLVCTWLFYFCWCREGGSNPHDRKGRRILSPLRLPVPPSRRFVAESLSYPMSTAKSAALQCNNIALPVAAVCRVTI